MSITYGFRLEWKPTPSSGTRCLSTEGHSDPESAYWRVMLAAEQWGYRRPRWWEYWRWKEVRPQMVENKEVGIG